MKTAAIKSLVYKEFYMARKPLLINLFTFFICAVGGILVEMSFQVGNLALLSDTIKSEIKNIIDFAVMVYPVLAACIGAWTLSDVSLKDENSLWKRFCYTLPADHFDFALAKYMVFLLTIIPEIVLSFAYTAVVCHVMGIRFSKLHLAYILAIIALTTLMAIVNHVGILLFHTKDKAGLFLCAVLAFIVLFIGVLINRTGAGPMSKAVVDNILIRLLPWLPVVSAAAMIIGCAVSAMLLKRREK